MLSRGCEKLVCPEGERVGMEPFSVSYFLSQFCGNSFCRRCVVSSREGFEMDWKRNKVR